MTNKKPTDNDLPELEATPGETLPPVPDSAYPEGATELPPAEVEIVMVRASRGAKPGDRRTISGDRAAELVGGGFAKYATSDSPEPS